MLAPCPKRNRPPPSTDRRSWRERVGRGGPRRSRRRRRARAQRWRRRRFRRSPSRSSRRPSGRAGPGGLGPHADAAVHDRLGGRGGCAEREQRERRGRDFSRVGPGLDAGLLSRRGRITSPRVRRIDAIVAAEEPERIGRRALSFGRAHPYLRVAGAYERLPSRVAARYWPHGGSRERGRSSDAHASSRSSSARSTRRTAGSGRDRPRRRGGGHRQDPARVRARADAPATQGSRSCSGARSISSARSCRTSRSSRRCARSETLRQVDEPPAGSQLRVFEETLALLTERAAAAPVLLVLEDLHWADTSTLDLVVFLAHNLDDRRVLLLATYRAGRASPRPSACAGSPTASGARARRSCSSSGRSRTTSWRRCSRPAPTPRCRRR